MQKSTIGDGAVFRKSLPAPEHLADPATSTDIDSGINWPVDPVSLLTLYLASPEHARCCHVKAEGAFGGGMIDASGKPLSALNEPAESGELFLDIGLDLEVYGNAFLQIVRNHADKVILIRRLPALHIKRLGKQGFMQTVRLAYGQEKRITFRPDEIIHLRPACPLGGYYAVPGWISAGGLMGLTKAAVEWNRKFFQNGAMPEYLFAVKGAQMSDAQKAAAKEFFTNEFRGLDNSHRTLFLQFDSKDVEVEAKKITADMKDGEFLKLLDSARDRIHLAHGVPPRILGIVTSGQLGGGGEVTGQLKVFEDLTLEPMRRRMLAQLRPLFRALGVDAAGVAFRPLDLTPPNVDRERLAEWVDAGIMTTEEARRMADLSGEPISKSHRSRLLDAFLALA